MQQATTKTAPANASAAGMIPVFNPATEELIDEVADSDQAAVDRAVGRARESFEAGVWQRLPAARRADVLWRAADIIKQRVAELAEIESKDNGMSLQHARNLVLASTEALYYYAGWCTKIQGQAVDIVTEGGYHRPVFGIPRLYVPGAGGRRRTDRSLERTFLRCGE
jgi:acyl-CoA reductase-like NAD-dependent aldehyde dehydrogenase